jgi:hypothetical protein
MPGSEAIKSEIRGQKTEDGNSEPEAGLESGYGLNMQVAAIF